MQNNTAAEPRVSAAQLPNQRTLPGGPAREPGAGFRPDIEGLRAIAVLLVVFCHAGVPFLAGGYVGVDVFFVLSGFLITGLLVREAEATGRISVARFYARRAVRLLPAAVLVMVATLVAARLWLPVTRLGGFVRDALAATGYAANLRFAVVGTDYLSADQSPSPFQHFWSLAVEEQFYLVWPLLILVAALLNRRRRTLAAVLGTLSLVSFVLSVTETARSAPWAYFGPHARAWELGAGALLALGARRVERLPGRLRAVLGWAGLAAVIAAALRFDDATPYPGWRAAVPVGGAVLLVAAGGAGVGRLLVLRPMQAVGRLSYGWYLWHWPMLLIGPAALGVRASLPVRLGLALAALIAAGIAYRIVENPIRRRATLRDHPRRGLGLGLSLSAAVAGVAVVIALLPHAVPRGGRQADLRALIDASADPAAALSGTIEASEALHRLPSNLTPTLAKAGADKAPVWSDGCHVDVPVTAAPDGCVFGDTTSATTVVLFGDSHAAQWFPAMRLLATRRHWKLVEMSKSSCSAADLPIWHDTLKRTYTECEAFHRSAVARIRSLHPSLVVIGSSFNYRPAQPQADVRAQWGAAWDRTFAELGGGGTRVVAIADTPYMGGSVPECLGKPANQKHIDRCTRTRHASLRGPEQRALFLAYAGPVKIIDPVDWFCTDACPPVVGNVLVYRDSNHMTTTYSTTLAPLLGAAIGF